MIGDTYSQKERRRKKKGKLFSEKVWQMVSRREPVSVESLKKRFSQKNEILSYFNRAFRLVLILTCISLLFTVRAEAQFGGKKILKEAEVSYEAEDWATAYELYADYLQEHPKNTEALYRSAVLLLKMDQPEKARPVLQALMEDRRNVPSEWYLTMGEIFHRLSDFKTAENYYRGFLEEADKKTDLRKVRYLLQQVATGHRFTPGFSVGYVENLGASVNRSSDEFGPVYSPNFRDRVYYTVRWREGEEPRSGFTFYGDGPHYRMMGAEVKQGIWRMQGPLDSALSGSQNMALLDFSEEGQMVLFESEQTARKKRVYYHYSSEDNLAFPVAWEHPEYKPDLGDRDLTRINDSAFLFSSHRLEGHGGYDLFVTYKKLGKWVVENLGPEINSPYDEISPFIADDDRTLFFSSNSTESMGGYDVFFSRFEDEKGRWIRPSNMGRPVNSGMDEFGFRMLDDGMEGVFSSNRAGGFGGFDLYQIFMTEHLFEAERARRPFFQSDSYRAFLGSGSAFEHERSAIPEVVLQPVSYERFPVVISSKIKSNLDQILHYCRLYPHIDLVMHIFAQNNQTDGFSLFQPYLLVEPIAEYLKKNGLSDIRLVSRIHGHQDFASRDAFDISFSPSFVYQKGQVEFELRGTKNLPVRFYPQDRIGWDREEEGDKDLFGTWRQKSEGLKFRIQWLRSPQLFRGELPSAEENMMMEISGPRQEYIYYLGMYDTMEEAADSLRHMKAKGFEGAAITAFLDGELLRNDQINVEMIERFPQLKEYIIYQQ